MMPARAVPRVLHLYRRFRPDFTGDGIYYEQLIPAMARLGSRHAVLVFETAAPAGPQGSDFPIHYLQANDRSALALARWIAHHRREFDILHIHTHVDRLFIAYAMARLVGWKVIYSSTLADRIDELVATYRPFYRPLARRLFSLVDVFVGISPRLFSGDALPPERARLIPQGVRTPEPEVSPARDATRASLGIGPGEILLLYVGSICGRKAVHLLLETFVQLSAQRPHLRLVLLGPVLEPDYGAATLAIAADAGLGDRVRHIAFDPNPDRFYAAADIFVFASVEEGFGNVLLEAMSHGLPVVSRYLDGVTEAFIEHERNGFLFSDADGFGRAVLRLIDDAALRARTGKAARETVARNFRLDVIAERYCDLYRGLGRQEAGGVPAPAIARVARKSSDFSRRKLNHRPERPTLLAVIDTESEFDWSQGVAADRGAVRSIEKLGAVQAIFERFGVTPCYVIDYPVATGATSAAVLREMAERGAEIGAHLQPWTTPPFPEPVNDRHAFPGNLPLWLQRQKLVRLGAAIEQAVGIKPRVFKAGRYGIGAATLALLEELDYAVDLSVAPGFDYRAEQGPDFREFGAEPFWFGRDRPLLELPTTSGFSGALRAGGAGLWNWLDRPALRQVRARGILDRTGLFSRIRLSPEGYSLAQMKRLTLDFIASGQSFLTLSFHSSSLQPGFTPYCRNEADVETLLARVADYLAFFREELGGAAASPLALYRQLLERDPP